MDFLDSLKSIKEEMQKEQNLLKKPKDKISKNKASLKTEQASKIAKSAKESMQELFLKEQRLRNEFAEFIKDFDIKKKY